MLVIKLLFAIDINKQIVILAADDDNNDDDDDDGGELTGKGA